MQEPDWRKMDWPTAFSEAVPWVCIAAVLIAACVFS